MTFSRPDSWTPTRTVLCVAVACDSASCDNVRAPSRVGAATTQATETRFTPLDHLTPALQLRCFKLLRQFQSNIEYATYAILVTKV